MLNTRSMNMRPESPDECFMDDFADKEFSLQPVFSGEKFLQVVAYPVIVESWDRVLSGGQTKRNYQHTFTEAERKTISRYRSKFHRWYLVSGTPKRVMLKLSTLELLQRAVAFFADPRDERYQAPR